MPARIGPGPVFVYEWLTTTRRWQFYAVRAVFVAAILAGMMFIVRVAQNPTPPGQATSRAELAQYGQRFYLTIVSIELAIVLLVAPAATAGAICLDKARGTLDHMLATDLSNAEIVLGKLGRAPGERARLDRVRASAHGAVGTHGRNRPHRGFRLVPGGNRLRCPGLLAGAHDIGLGPQNPGRAHLHVFDHDVLAVQPLSAGIGLGREWFVFDQVFLTRPCRTGSTPSTLSTSSGPRT